MEGERLPVALAHEDAIERADVQVDEVSGLARPAEVQPRPPFGRSRQHIATRSVITGCLARAGDCAGAWTAWQNEPNLFYPAGAPPLPDVAVRAQFDAATQSKCKKQ